MKNALHNTMNCKNVYAVDGWSPLVKPNTLSS